MSYITGYGNLRVCSVQSSNTLGNRSKEITSNASDIEAEKTLFSGLGLAYENGEILSFYTKINFDELQVSGSGISDNLYYLPRITLQAMFKVQPLSYQAEFQLG